MEAGIVEIAALTWPEYLLASCGRLHLIRDLPGDRPGDAPRSVAKFTHFLGLYRDLLGPQRFTVIQILAARIAVHDWPAVEELLGLSVHYAACGLISASIRDHNALLVEAENGRRRVTWGPVPDVDFGNWPDHESPAGTVPARQWACSEPGHDEKCPCITGVKIALAVQWIPDLV